MGLPLETLLLIAILAVNVFYAMIHLPLVIFFVRLRTFLLNFLGGFTNPENRKGLWLEIGHGVGRALLERAGSLKGAAARSDGAIAGGLAALEGGGGASLGKLLPGKVDLPIVGKVSMGEAIQIGLAIKHMLQGGNILQGLGGASTSGQSAGAGSGALP